MGIEELDVSKPGAHKLCWLAEFDSSLVAEERDGR